MESVLEFNLQGLGKRLDVALTEYFLVEQQSFPKGYQSRSKISELISDGLVAIDDEIITKSSYLIKNDCVVCIAIPNIEDISLEPDSSIPIEVVFEDEQVLVINKQAGLVVHPGAGNYQGTLVNGLLSYLGTSLLRLGDRLRPGIVHRLDKDTTGLMVVAKTEEAFHGLTKQFLPPRSISRKYLALTTKLPLGATDDNGVIEASISRSVSDRKKMAVVNSGGKGAVSYWKVRENLANGFLLELELETGRTHQIRVHLQYAKSPIVGDQIYSGWENGLNNSLLRKARDFGRQALHAEKLSFVHPKTKERIEFSANAPTEMLKLIKSFNE